MRQDGICHIVSAAPCAGLQLAPAPGDMVIAADGGYRLCRAAGVVPNLFIGDCDSCSADELPAPDALERIELPCDKDDTDTVAAMRVGLERGYRSFEVHAALGGDVGHELANIQSLLFLRDNGAKGVLRGDAQALVLVCPEDGLAHLHAYPDMRVSVFALAGTARGVTEKGLRWELDDAVIEPTFPLGVSNRALGETIGIGVRDGVLAIVLG